MYRKSYSLLNIIIILLFIACSNSYAHSDKKQSWKLFKEADRLYNGVGVKKNKNKARKIFKKLCNESYWQACSNYGLSLYDIGKYREAEKIFLNNIKKYHDEVSLGNIIHLYREKKYQGASEVKAQKYEKLLLKWKYSNSLNQNVP